MDDTAIFFCGLSKNCNDTIKKNLEFINEFIKIVDFTDVKVITVDSDSNDGTKEYLKSFSSENDFSIHVNADGLEEIYNSRIERIAHCRNICLDTMYENSSNNSLVYLPLDLDIDLFKNVSIDEFKNLLIAFLEDASTEACFPFSTPFYYDIFALRCENWLEINSQQLINKLKKIFLFGSFFLNYVFIFRKQKSINQFKVEKIKVTSAFGGAGMYKFNLDEIKKVRYHLSEENPEFISEHIFFNSYFENLYINTNWTIPAPSEHINFKVLNFYEKFIYFLKTIKFDLKKIFDF